MTDKEIVDKLIELTNLLLEGGITKEEHSDQVVMVLFDAAAGRSPEQQMWQLVWDKCSGLGNEVKDKVFEALVEAGWDVEDDVVIRPERRRSE